MSDLFHPEVPDEFLDRVFAVMALADRHTFQVLTKRPERMRAYLNGRWGGESEEAYDRADIIHAAMGTFVPENERDAIELRWPIPNVWLGTSVENARWRTRIDELRQTTAAVRFLSCEPLLGPLTKTGLDAYEREDAPRIDVALANPLDLSGIDWVIVGGESGPNARPMSEAWARGIVTECRRQGALPFVKQMGTIWAVDHGLGRTHGGDWDKGWPEDLRVREMPPLAVA